MKFQIINERREITTKFPSGHSLPSLNWPDWVPLTAQRANTAHNRQRVSKDDFTERKSDSDPATGHKQHT